MKRFLIAGVALITVLALTGCGATGYTTGRAQKNAGDAANKVAENTTGKTSQEINTYSVGAKSAAEAQALGINTAILLGNNYQNTVFDEIGVAVSIAKDASAASMAIFLSYLNDDNVYLVTFRSVGTVTSGQSGFQFQAQECDEKGNIMSNGATITVFGANFGSNVVVTTNINGGVFTSNTPLQLMVN